VTLQEDDEQADEEENDQEAPADDEDAETESGEPETTTMKPKHDQARRRRSATCAGCIN
jgi:hypothetical protein